MPVRIHLDILMSVIVTLSTTFFPGSTSLHFQLLYVLPTPEWHREDGVSGELQSVYYSFPLPLPPPQCFLLFLHYLLSSGHISWVGCSFRPFVLTPSWASPHSAGKSLAPTAFLLTPYFLILVSHNNFFSLLDLSM